MVNSYIVKLGTNYIFSISVYQLSVTCFEVDIVRDY